MSIITARDLGTVDGFRITAHTEEDFDTYFEDMSGIYDADERAAYLRGEWNFVVLIVSAARAGMILGTASLRGTDNGRVPGRRCDPLRDDRIQAYGLVDNAITAARATLAKITEMGMK